jgi:hypothetical protein
VCVSHLYMYMYKYIHVVMEMLIVLSSDTVVTQLNQVGLQLSYNLILQFMFMLLSPFTFTSFSAEPP